MHALATLTGAMGRCGKGSKTCGQLIQQVGLETCAPIGNEDRATRRFKRCNEPSVNVRCRRRRDPDGTAEADERPVNHYTINIYMNDAPKDRVLYADSTSSPCAFSVDKLTKTIATSSPVIEGFLRNKDPDKDRDCIEEKLGAFWKEVFENSKLDREENRRRGPDEDKTQIKLETKRSETNLAEPSSERPKEEDKAPFFLSENRNERVYVNKEFKLETRAEQAEPRLDLPATIPHYERGFYDSRTVKPKKIVSPDNQARRRLSQDVEEVNRHIKDLVELSTRNQSKESSLSKIIAYCKSFLTKDPKPKATSSGFPKGSLFPNGVLGGYYGGRRRYHQATCGYLKAITATNHSGIVGGRYDGRRRLTEENKGILCHNGFLTKDTMHSGIVGGYYDDKKRYHRATLGYLEMVDDTKKSYFSTEHNEENKQILCRGSFLTKNAKSLFPNGCYDDKNGLDTVTDTAKRYLSSQQNEGNKPKDLYSNVEKSLTGAAIEKEMNLAKQASGFTLYNLILSLNNGAVRPSKPTLPRTLRFSKPVGRVAKPTSDPPKFNAPASRCKSEANLGGEPDGLRPARIRSEEILSYAKFSGKPFAEKWKSRKLLTEGNAAKTKGGATKKYDDAEESKSSYKKILRKRKRKNKPELSAMRSGSDASGKKSLKFEEYAKRIGKFPQKRKTVAMYSATVSNVSSKKHEAKARDVRRKASTLKTVPFTDSLTNQIRTIDKKPTKKGRTMAGTVYNLRTWRTGVKNGITMKYKTNSVFKEEIGAVSTQRHPGFRVHSRALLAQPRKQIGSFKRTICHDSSSNFDNKCKKQKRHGKKECDPTSKRLAVRDSECPKEPLKYQDLYPRCDESLKSAIPQKDLVADIKGLLDNKKKEQFDCYFGEGGYKNYEYYSYTRTSFYDVNNYMTPSRNPQPSSGAKPK